MSQERLAVALTDRRVALKVVAGVRWRSAAK